MNQIASRYIAILFGLACLLGLAFAQGGSGDGTNRNSPANVKRANTNARPRATPRTMSRPPVVRNQYGIELVRIPAGSFMMGSENGILNERPVQRVYAPAFYMSRYEVTQGQGQREMGNNPSHFHKIHPDTL